MTFSARPRRQARRFDEVTRRCFSCNAARRVTLSLWRKESLSLGGNVHDVTRPQGRELRRAAPSRADDGSSFVLYRRRFFLSAFLIRLMRSVGRWTCYRHAERGARRPFALAGDSCRGERCFCCCRRHDPPRACAFARAVEVSRSTGGFATGVASQSFVRVALQLRRGL